MKTNQSSDNIRFSSEPQVHHCDLLVAGGGIGGVCTALAGARHGLRVILIQDRPVLGGNASSEVNVMPAGANAMGYNKDARETGIMEEIFVERSARSPDRSCRFVDDILAEWLEREPLVTLFLNTQLTCASRSTKQSQRIESIETIEAVSGKRMRVFARYFADCTGDSVLAHEAGASWRMGREAASEFNESMAPAQADSKVMGCTLPYQIKDMGKPVAFTPPAIARNYASPDSFPLRYHDGPPGVYWWAEWGGDLDTITQYQEIRDELTRIVYGLWDHLKNHGNHGADNYALLRLGPILGKRESRRVEGPVMLVQSDLETGRNWDDAVAYGGWPIDIHPPAGIDSPEAPAEQIFVDPYPIPLRALYSKDVSNLFITGRNISVSHVALGSTRVMGTIATLGQAIGTAAALCKQTDSDPHQLDAQAIHTLQQTLLRDDAYLIGLRNEDPNDHARHATVSATSDAPLSMESGSQWRALDGGCAQLFAVTATELRSVCLLLKNTTDSPQRIGLELHRARHLFDFTSHSPLVSTEAEVPASSEGYVTFPFALSQLEPGFYWVKPQANPHLQWRSNEGVEPAGTKTGQWDEEAKHWFAYRGYHVVETADWVTYRGCHTFRLDPPSRPHTAEQVISGVSRAEQMPSQWVSDPSQPMPQSLTLSFTQPVALRQILLTFDTDLDHRIPPAFCPRTVRDYRLWASHAGKERLVAEVSGNYHRRRQHDSDGSLADAIRLEVLATNGDKSARVFEVRVYS